VKLKARYKYLIHAAKINLFPWLEAAIDKHLLMQEATA
jgi:hypothetical protein